MADASTLMLRVLYEFRAELHRVKPAAHLYAADNVRPPPRAKSAPGAPLIQRLEAEGALQRAIAKVLSGRRIDSPVIADTLFAKES